MVYCIEGKVVLVTGANRGIGKAFVDAFLSHGAAKVYAAVRNVETSQEALLGKDGEGRIILIPIDLKDPDTIFAAARIATDVDVVVNNAGINHHTGIFDKDAVERLQDEMDINVYGFMHIARAFAPLLEQREGRGILVQVNSAASIRCAAPSVATYSASKACSFSITQAIRQELKEKGVHVVSIHPGPIATDMIASAGPQVKEMAGSASNVAESLITALTRGNYTTCDDSLKQANGDDSDKPDPPFLIFPDEQAKRLGLIFEPYAKRVIEEGNNYG